MTGSSGTAAVRKSLPNLTPGRLSVPFSEGASSRSSSRNNSLLPNGNFLPRLSVSKVSEDTGSVLGDEGERSQRPRQTTIKFIYSEAVERAFRRRYMCSDFGPGSAAGAGRSEQAPSVDIVALPQLYEDFVFIKALTARKAEYLRKMREELGDDYYITNRFRRKAKSRNRGYSMPDTRRGSLASTHGGGGEDARRPHPRLPAIIDRRRVKSPNLNTPVLSPRSSRRGSHSKISNNKLPPLKVKSHGNV